MKNRIISIFLVIMLLLSASIAYAADPIPVESLTLSDINLSIPIKKSINLKATIEPKNATNKKIVWTSSDDNIATVKNGKVTAVNFGTAIITASAEDGSNASVSAEITVVNPIKKITTETKLVLAPNITWEMGWTIEPEDATNKDIEWSSSKEDVASVDEKGIISTHAKGNCKITGTAKDGSNAKTTINVQVIDHEIVILVPGEVNVDFETEPQFYESEVSMPGFYSHQTWERRFQTQNGCVVSESNKKIKPVKAGSDTIMILEIDNGRTTKKEKHTVFVARSAVGESSASQEGNGENEVLFMGIPWGTTYPEVKALLEKKGKTVKALAQYNNSLRATVEGEVDFANCIAFKAAVNFTYNQEDDSYNENNSFYKGDFYFDPDLSFENIRQAVMNVYGLDAGESSGEKYKWEQGNVHIELTKKEKYTILEILNGACEKSL